MQVLLSWADLLAYCYQVALPGTPKLTEQHSDYSSDLGGAMGIRTPDLLRAMNPGA
jgi:hypothetical protein